MTADMQAFSTSKFLFWKNTLLSILRTKYICSSAFPVSCSWVAEHLVFNKNYEASVFETTIRYSSDELQFVCLMLQLHIISMLLFKENKFVSTGFCQDLIIWVPIKGDLLLLGFKFLYDLRIACTTSACPSSSNLLCSKGKNKLLQKLSWKAAPNYSVLEIKPSTSPSVPCANKNIHIVTIMDPAIRK